MPIPGAAGPGAKFPQWTVNTTGWIVAEVINAQAKALAIATTFPNKLIFFTSKNAADAYVRSQGATPIVSPLAKVGGQAVINAGSTVAADVLGQFNIGAWFLRIGEIVLGVVLIGVGVARITGAQNAISKVVKAKIPL